MKYSPIFLIASVAGTGLLCLNQPVTAASQAKDKALIQSAIQKMDDAADKRDAAGCVAFTHPDFVNFDKTGKETTHGKEARQARYSKLFSQATKVDQQTTLTHIIFSQQGAVVDKQSSTSITMTENGHTLELNGGGTYRDFWVKSAGIWLQKKSQTLTETFHVKTFALNGNPRAIHGNASS